MREGAPPSNPNRLDLPDVAVPAGVFDFPKATGGSTAITAGSDVYWDAGAEEATTNAAAGANKLIGKTILDAVDADAFVRVRMNQ